jgi:thioredoxin reductase
MSETLPIVIIGAGPVGLAAGAHALARGLTPLVLESGDSVGAGIRRWGHVRVFSPWRFNIDKASALLLAERGWQPPDGDTFPTGEEIVNQYLQPLAHRTRLAPHVRLQTRVVSVTRRNHDLMKDGSRESAPFQVRVIGPSGEEDILAQAVIDASGTTSTPGPLGASGISAIGETTAAGRIYYGIPDVLGALRSRYANRRVLVVGSGHSALNALLDLTHLLDEAPGTRVFWAIRRPTLGHLLGGPRPDQLEERGRLGSRVRTLLDEGRMTLVTGVAIDAVIDTPAGLVVRAGERRLEPVDEIIAATGFRPDWSILSELRLDLDPAVQSTRALAPLIDPNVHSCGSVRPHGADELQHPEANLFVIGMKSYGRAPTFLMLTGYEQARSVVSAIAGDWESARRVELELPETGVCSSDAVDGASACCGSGPATEAALVAVPSVQRTGKLLATIPAASTCC